MDAYGAGAAPPCSQILSWTRRTNFFPVCANHFIDAYGVVGGAVGVVGGVAAVAAGAAAGAAAGCSAKAALQYTSTYLVGSIYTSDGIYANARVKN